MHHLKSIKTSLSLDLRGVGGGGVTYLSMMFKNDYFFDVVVVGRKDNADGV